MTATHALTTDQIKSLSDLVEANAVNVDGFYQIDGTPEFWAGYWLRSNDADRDAVVAEIETLVFHWEELDSANRFRCITWADTPFVEAHK